MRGMYVEVSGDKVHLVMQRDFVGSLILIPLNVDRLLSLCFCGAGTRLQSLGC